LDKVRHIAVVAVFGLMGTRLVMDALRPYPRLNIFTWPFQGIELDIFEGIGFLLSAYGVYRFNSKFRYFALLLTALSIFVGVIGLLAVPQITTLLWLPVWLLVLWWFLSPAVRYQFQDAGKHTGAS
jgi:hypothetical protein